MMSILQRYTLRELAAPLGLGLMVFTFVFLIGQIFKLTELLLNSGVSPLLAGELILSLLPGILSVTIPMAVLVAILLGIGRLAADREILAIRMSGVNLVHISIPVIIVAAVLSGLMIWANQTLVPYLNLKMADLATQIEFNILSAIPPDRAFSLQGGQEGSSSMLFFEERDPESQDMKGVCIRTVMMSEDAKAEKRKSSIKDQMAQLRKKAIKDKVAQKEIEKLEGRLEDIRSAQRGSEALIVAQSGRIVPEISERLITIELTTGTMHLLNPDRPDSYNIVRFATMAKGIRPRFQKTEQGVFRKSPREMSSAELKTRMAEMERRGRVDKKYRGEYFSRLSIPLACIAFALVAIPLAIYVRPTGKAIAFAIAFFVILLYYGLLNYGISLGSTGHPMAPLAIFMPNVVLSAVGLVLMYRMVMK